MKAITEKGRKGLGETVYQYMIKQILSGEITCGERIPEDRLAAQFGISRTPIREALRRLDSDGLVTIYPKRYAEVVSFTPADVKNLGIVRLSQDVLAAQLAIYNGSNADFDHLQEMSEKCRFFSGQDDLYMKIKSDAEFHLHLSRISGNPLLYSMQETLYKKVRLLMMDYGTARTCDIALHDEIVRGLKQRDTEYVVQSIVEHLAGFYDLSQITGGREVAPGLWSPAI